MPNLPIFLSGRAPLKDITKIVDRLEISPSGNLETVSSEGVGIASVQFLCRRYTSLEDYIVDMNLYVSDAVNRRAQLVIFPAYTGLLPFSIAPQFENAFEKLRSSVVIGKPGAKALNECLSYYSDYIYDTYYAVMSALAAKHQVYIMAGSTLYFDSNELRHRAFLFDNTGGLAGYQDKLGLSRLEQELAIEEACEINVFETPIAPVSILIGDDVEYFEAARVAKELGARIIINPTIHSGEYTPADAAGGLNLRVQENRLYGIRSVMVGDNGFGSVMESPSCIFAPNSLIRAKNGILEKSSGRPEPDILYRSLDIDRLDSASDPYTKDTNPAFMERYADRLY